MGHSNSLGNLKLVNELYLFSSKMSVVKKFPVEKEYEKNPDITPEEIEKLRQWLDTQPHLPGKHLTGDLIIHSSNNLRI